MLKLITFTGKSVTEEVME